MRFRNPPARAKTIGLLLLVLMALGMPAGALAGEEASTLDFKVQLNASTRGSYSFSNQVFYWCLAGVSFSMEFKRNFAVEVGGGWGMFNQWDAYVLGGWITDLHDGRGADSRGWVLQASTLGGVRGLRLAVERDGSLAKEDNLFIQALMGLDLSYWLNGDFAFNLKLSGGASVSVWAEPDWSWAKDPNADQNRSWLMADLSLTFGLTF